MLELLSAILETANDAFMESESLSLFPGEYMDGSIAPPDITEVDIEIDPLCADIGMSWLWVKVSTSQQGGWIAYLQSNCRTGKLEGVMVTTLEGYCKQNCDCPMCEVMRSQSVSAA